MRAQTLWTTVLGGGLLLCSGLARAQDDDTPASTGGGLYPTEPPPLTVGTGGPGGLGGALNKARGVKATRSTDRAGAMGSGEDPTATGASGTGGGVAFVYMGGGPSDDYSSGGGYGGGGGYGSWGQEYGGPGYRNGIVPLEHIVRPGDTLWDICGFYFGDPWRWPSVWSLNTQITNPHWIYPGDKVRLRKEGELPAAASRDGQLISGTGTKAPYDPRVRVRQSGFVDPKALADSGTIVGSTEEKEMLGDYDGVYIQFPKNSKNPPVAGRRYTVYRVEKSLESKKGKNVGVLIKNLGTIEVLKVPKGALPVARVLETFDVIERGDRLNVLRDDQRNVSPTDATVDLEGSIIEELRVVNNELIGEDNLVIIDLGKKQGLKVGNMVMVVRRGDALDDVGSPDGVPEDDKSYPYEVIADLMVMDVSESSAIAVVVNAVVEIGKGEKVLVRKPAR